MINSTPFRVSPSGSIIHKTKFVMQVAVFCSPRMAEPHHTSAVCYRPSAGMRRKNASLSIRKRQDESAIVALVTGATDNRCRA